MGNHIGLFNKKSNESTTIHVEPKRASSLTIVTNTSSPNIQPKRAPTMRTSKTFTFENVLPVTPATYISRTATSATSPTIFVPELIVDSAVNTCVSVSKIKLGPYEETPVESMIKEEVVVEDNTSISSEESSVSEIEENHPSVIPETNVPHNSPVCDYKVHNTKEHTVLYKKMSHLML